MTRFDSPAEPPDTGAAMAAAGAGAGEPTIWPGVGGGSGTSGLAPVAVTGDDVETDGVGRDGYGVPDSGIAGVTDGWRRIPGIPAGVAGAMVADRTGVEDLGVIAGFVNGVVAPTVILRIAPQTLQRALTPFGGTFAGSTRNTDRQS